MAPPLENAPWLCQHMVPPRPLVVADAANTSNENMPTTTSAYDFDSYPLATPQPWPVMPLDCWTATQPPTSVGNTSAGNVEPVMSLEPSSTVANMVVLPTMAPPLESAPRFYQHTVPPPPLVVANVSDTSNENKRTTTSVLRLAETLELGNVEIPTVG